MTLEQTSINHTTTITNRIRPRFAYSFEAKTIAPKTSDKRSTIFRYLSSLSIVLLIGIN